MIVLLLCLYWVITDYSFTVLLSLRLYLIVCVDCEWQVLQLMSNIIQNKVKYNYLIFEII